MESGLKKMNTKIQKIIVPGNADETIDYCVEDFIKTANDAIKDHGYFAVALSGGSTPKNIYQKLAQEKKDALDWSKVWLFWSDERAVPPTDPESNYHMAMEAGFKSLPIPESQIFRMVAEDDIEMNAKKYEELIRRKIPSKRFDLMMLGMGDDGHTASLFPKTHALHADGRLVVANFIPDKDVWRMSVTFDCINDSAKTVVAVLGSKKASVLEYVFDGPFQPDHLPIQGVGTETKPAHFILDNAAAADLTL